MSSFRSIDATLGHCQGSAPTLQLQGLLFERQRERKRVLRGRSESEEEEKRNATNTRVGETSARRSALTPVRGKRKHGMYTCWHGYGSFPLLTSHSSIVSPFDPASSDISTDFAPRQDQPSPPACDATTLCARAVRWRNVRQSALHACLA